MHQHPQRSRTVVALSLALPLHLAIAVHGDMVDHEPVSPPIAGHFGASVALVGDIDFDGYADMLVGAPGETAGGVSKAGRVHIYSGKTGAILRTHTSATPAIGGAFGAAVIGLPDLNFDGRSEYAIGAPNEESGKGRVRVYSGATGVQMWSATGLSGTLGHGGCLAVVPDCSGDGVVELAVGNGGDNLGQTSVRLYQSATGLSWKAINRPANVDGAIAFGHAIGGIPDVTGDGKGDVIVGASRADGSGLVDRGAAWIFNGATGAFVREIVTIDPETSGWFGAAVAGIGDLDGDGRGDVLVGAPHEDTVNDSLGVGRVHAFSGASGAHLYSVTLSTAWSGAGFGSALAVAANLDDDGVPDFVVGAPGGGSSQQGWMFRFAGADGDAIGYSIAVLSSSKGFGSSVSAAGDCTQDGRSDIVGGAPYSTAGGVEEAGKATLVRLVANDSCSPSFVPPEIGVGGTYFSNVGATSFQDVEGDCGGTTPELLNSDVHFTFQAPTSGTATFSTCASTYDTWIALYRGCDFTEFGCPFGPPDACNDDGASCQGGGSAVSLPVAAGECIRVRVGGVGSEQGIATVQVDFAEGCTGDLDGNGVVDGGDLAMLLGAWGSNALLDLSGDGVVDGTDLGVLLGGWGSCS